MRLASRHLEERLAIALMVGATLVVIGTLLLLVATVVVKGLPAMSWEMVSQVPRGGYYLGGGGGILNAIVGSLVLGAGATAIALAISLPLAMYVRFYLPRRSRFAFAVRFVLDLLWGIPSIVYGAFGFALMLVLGLGPSLAAGTLTVALLVTPILARNIDEVLRLLPDELAESAYALGSTRFEVAFKVALRQARRGVVAAVLIAFGRGIGDAASVLFTASFTDSLPYSLTKPVATLPLAIFFQLGTPFPEVQQRGYAAALILTVILLAVSVSSRALTGRLGRRAGD